MSQDLDAAPSAATPSLAQLNWSLFLISAAGLFLELLLIRWVSTEIRIFAYLQNTVLVVCFLGLGMGCWNCQKPFALRDMLIPLGILVGLLSIPATRRALGGITIFFDGFRDLLIWGRTPKSSWELVAHPIIGLAMTMLLMMLLWDVFVPVGRLLGRLLADHPRTISAYSVNVAGSLAGIWAFVGLSAANLPPVMWFAGFAALAAYFAGSGGKSKVVDYALLAAIVGVSILAGWDPGYPETHWSPYQKLSVRPVDLERRGPDEIGAVRINVNNTNYQEIIDLRPEMVAARPDLYPPAQRGLSQYDLPSKLHPNPASVLIVGAGSGNDVAGALRNGAKRVVAVEIDPVIIEVGKQYHPERPYADPRVEVVNDDARSYFATSTEKFDVIVFGLLDSHTTTGGMSNARLDHYVYTRESIDRAKGLLAPGGVMLLSFYAERPFIVDRMARTVNEVFGKPSIVFWVLTSNFGRGGAVFVNGDLEAVERQFIADPRLAEQIRAWQAARQMETPGTTRVATDDWPYIYLEKPDVPVLYFLLAGVLAVLFVRGLWKLGRAEVRGAWGKSGLHFFFLGAAFMLLEVQNISKAAVVLGNTWAVNAVIISGVLVMVLLANLIAAKLPRLPLGLVYALLVGSCLGLFMLDLSRFAFLPYATKAVVVGLLTSLPMLFSGIVFIRSFAAADRKDAALGANLMGALVGGLLQSVTFLTGIAALLLIVAALYGGAFATRPRCQCSGEAGSAGE
ncbi:MAG TPA: methyltransferase domain-containing protein [Gemmataceae bacterium]|nr:methyltransferase domain-containing protein [Gemmataceae bacterium]